MAKRFRTLREALSHAAVHGRPHGTRCALGGASHWQSGDDGPDEGEALVIRTIVMSAVKNDEDARDRVYVWAVSGGNDGYCPEYLQKVLRKRLRRAKVLAPAVKAVRVKKVVREGYDGEDVVTMGVDDGRDQNQTD